MSKIRNLISNAIQRAKNFYANDKRSIYAGIIGFAIAFFLMFRFD